MLKVPSWKALISEPSRLFEETPASSIHPVNPLSAIANSLLPKVTFVFAPPVFPLINGADSPSCLPLTYILSFESPDAYTPITWAGYG